jgi:hypothetical protein
MRATLRAIPPYTAMQMGIDYHFFEFLMIDICVVLESQSYNSKTPKIDEAVLLPLDAAEHRRHFRATNGMFERDAVCL